jgi:hypothetical protein
MRPRPPDQNTSPLPPRLRFLNVDTIDNLATIITACTAAIRDGDQVRGMEPLILLDALSDLLRDAAQRERA